MYGKGLITLSEAALRSGVERTAVSRIVKALGIPTHRMPLNGTAKGLDPAGLRRLAQGIVTWDGLDPSEEDRIFRLLTTEPQTAASA